MRRRSICNGAWEGSIHGTHTMGTMVGNDGGLNQIGGFFPPNTEVDAPAFATSADVPWLSADLLTATIAPGAQQTVLIPFDASVVSSPGKYEAVLQFDSDTPYAPLTIPVTMIVGVYDRKSYLPLVGRR